MYLINPLIPGHENDLRYPFAIWNPWKILANLGAIVLIAGCVKAIADRIGDNLDADIDADGLPDDLNRNGTPDGEEPDWDSDGIPQSGAIPWDAFPRDRHEWRDTDGDGTGDNADADDDGDGYPDREEEQADTDPLDPISFPQAAPP